MRTGTPAGVRTCTQRFNTRFLSTGLSRSFRTQRLGPPTWHGGRPLKPCASLTSKDAVPALVSYTVQKGETLWDVAVQHGVSMRTIKDLNKLSGAEPVLTEGQQLLVPASGITAVATLDGVTTAAALGSTPARGLWVGSDHVRLATVSEAKELYLRQCDRGNSQNTLLVLYAPWCPHCRDMEDELERLAEGLSHVAAVRVVAVDCDSAEGRMFAREVLGVAYYPSIISFPEHSRTFFKYKGRQRDAESLLRFLNMTCCAREDQMWSLRPVGLSTTVVMPGGKWINQLLPVGTSPGAMASAIGLLALAAATVALVAARRRRVVAAGEGAVVEAEIVAELDSSLGRMGALMVRVIGTRLGLMLGLVGSPPSPQQQQQPASNADGGGASETPAAAPSPPAGRAAGRLRNSSNGNGNGNGAHVAAASALPMPPPRAASLDSSRVLSSPSAAAATATFAAAAAPDVSLAAATTPRGLTAEERMRLTRLTDDELIALVNSDPDLDKVLSRLLGDK